MYYYVTNLPQFSNRHTDTHARTEKEQHYEIVTAACLAQFQLHLLNFHFSCNQSAVYAVQ